MQKPVTAVDVVVEILFGAVVGCAIFFFLAGGRGVTLPHPVFAVAMTILFGQLAIDLARGRGWTYSLACAGSCGAGVLAGGYGAFAGTVLGWWAPTFVGA